MVDKEDDIEIRVPCLVREAAGVQQVTVGRCNKGGGGTKEQVKGERERE